MFKFICFYLFVSVVLSAPENPDATIRVTTSKLLNLNWKKVTLFDTPTTSACNYLYKIAGSRNVVYYGTAGDCSVRITQHIAAMQKATNFRDQAMCTNLLPSTAFEVGHDFCLAAFEFAPTDETLEVWTCKLDSTEDAKDTENYMLGVKTTDGFCPYCNNDNKCGTTSVNTCTPEEFEERLQEILNDLGYPGDKCRKQSPPVSPEPKAELIQKVEAVATIVKCINKTQARSTSPISATTSLTSHSILFPPSKLPYVWNRLNTASSSLTSPRSRPCSPSPERAARRKTPNIHILSTAGYTM
jgi:hypothetical protein